MHIHWQTYRRDHERAGFTLVELMIVVAIIAVLAVVATVAYTRHIKKSRMIEAYEMLGQIQMRQETYFEANQQYCNASAGGGFYPALAGGFEPKTWNTTTLPAGFNTLGVRVDKGSVYFSYLVVAGDPAAAPPFASVTVEGITPESLGITINASPTPTTPWFFAVARGDMSGAATDFTEMRVTSERKDVVVVNEGK